MTLDQVDQTMLWIQMVCSCIWRRSRFVPLNFYNKALYLYLPFGIYGLRGIAKACVGGQIYRRTRMADQIIRTRPVEAAISVETAI